MGANRDAKRFDAGTPTRVGHKKPYKAVTLTYEQAKQLKRQPDTPQGQRDALLFHLVMRRFGASVPARL